MYFLSILFFIVVYIFLAVISVKITTKITNSKRCKWFVVVFVVMLPTWDVILGYLVYYPACLFIPKVAIYETAETDGIYYEGMNDYIFRLKNRGKKTTENELIRVGAIDRVFRYGFTFAESLVTYEHFDYTKQKKIPPVIYRCKPLPKDESCPAFQKTSCSIFNDIKSSVMVNERSVVLGTTSIMFKSIFNRATNKIIAECNQVVRKGVFPFFYWLNWQEGSGSSFSCPNTDRYYFFEFEVLKPKK